MRSRVLKQVIGHQDGITPMILINLSPAPESLERPWERGFPSLGLLSPGTTDFKGPHLLVIVPVAVLWAAWQHPWPLVPKRQRKESVCILNE